MRDDAASITSWSSALAFDMVLVIAATRGHIRVRKVRRIEHLNIFRG